MYLLSQHLQCAPIFDPDKDKSPGQNQQNGIYPSCWFSSIDFTDFCFEAKNTYLLMCMAIDSTYNYVPMYNGNEYKRKRPYCSLMSFQDFMR